LTAAFVFFAHRSSLISQKDIRDKSLWGLFTFLALLLTSILVSLSRSYWVGLAAAAPVYGAAVIIFTRNPFSFLARAVVSVMCLILASMAIVTATVLFPFPPPAGGFSAGSLLRARVSNLTGGEAAMLGHGFGKELMYITKDPRILAMNPTGEYVTYAFEWGYLELIVKYGVLGLCVYLGILLSLFWRTWQGLHAYARGALDEGGLWFLAFGLGGLVLVATHVFSPYLNHPLGIGFILFWGLFLDMRARERVEKQSQQPVNIN
jgi:hypothetical protein